MNHRTATVLACAVLATATAGCASAADPIAQQPSSMSSTATTGTSTPASSGTATSSASSSSAQTQTPSAPPSTTTKPNVPLPKVESSAFGQGARFRRDNVPFTVTVGKPVPATCKRPGVGCGEPKIGARFVTVPISFLNRGKAPVEIWASEYLLVFPDGTRTTIFDGRAPGYAPASGLLNIRASVRPGSTLDTSLTFEAPKGTFAIVMRAGGPKDADLHLWK